MNDNIEISIVIVTYNAEKYIEKTINSILKAVENLKNIEIIIVDNNSIDKTVNIVCNLISTEKIIKLEKLAENKGPGSARNKGIELAKGKYLFFFDDDDWIEENMITEMYRIAKNGGYDSVICGYSQDILENGKIKNQKKSIIPECICLTNREVIKKIFEIDYYKNFSFVWNKIYSTKIIKKNNIRFNSKMFGEDFDFNLEYFQYINSLKIINKAFYHYIKHSKNSLTEKKIENFFENIEQRFNDLEALMIRKKIMDKKSQQYFGIVVAKHLLSVIVREFGSKNNKKQIIEKVFTSNLYIKTRNNMKGLKIKEKVYCFILRRKLRILLISFVEIINYIKTRNKVLFQIFK